MPRPEEVTFVLWILLAFAVWVYFDWNATTRRRRFTSSVNPQDAATDVEARGRQLSTPTVAAERDLAGQVSADPTRPPAP